MRKIAFEIVVLLFLIGYIVLFEVFIHMYPGNYIPVVAGIVISLIYTALIIYSPQRVRLMRVWAAVSIIAMLYWVYLLIQILSK